MRSRRPSAWDLVVAPAALIAFGLCILSIYRHSPGVPLPWIKASAFALAGVLLLTSLRLAPSFRAILGVGCIAIAVAAYSAELVFEKVDQGADFGILPTRALWGIDLVPVLTKRTFAARAAAAGVQADTRDRMDVIAELQGRGVPAVPAIMVGNLLEQNPAAGPLNPTEFLPLGGISGATTILCNQTGQYVRYESDDYGFRNPAGTWDSPRIDVAVVGQSHVQGYCVNDGKVFVDRLRSPGRVVLNLGMSGEAPLLQLAALREYVARRAPRVVLWCFSEGIDFPDLQTQSRFPMPMRYLDATYSQTLASRQAEIDTTLRKYLSALDGQNRELLVDRARRPGGVDFGALLKLWKVRDKMGLMSDADQVDGDSQAIASELSTHLFKRTLTEAQRLTRSWGSTLYVVYLPSWSRYRNGLASLERERLLVLGYAKELGIPVIDTEAAFRAQADPLSLFPFRMFGHYNDAGHQLIADRISATLSTN